ncbi:MAG TPA: hypothetical protein EYP59_18605 [Thiotrichaceae bacterium]|nr:hypothetical protein [Thiotrichaceae bacterium]
MPEKLVIPVMGAKTTGWNHQTFWYEAWGRSGVHKGIDIFAKKKTPSFDSIKESIVTLVICLLC